MNTPPPLFPRKSLQHTYTLKNNMQVDVCVENIPADIPLSEELIDRFLDAGKYTENCEGHCTNISSKTKAYQISGTPYFVIKYAADYKTLHKKDIYLFENRNAPISKDLEFPRYCGDFYCHGSYYTIVAGKSDSPKGITNETSFLWVIVNPSSYIQKHVIKTTTPTRLALTEELLKSTENLPPRLLAIADDAAQKAFGRSPQWNHQWLMRVNEFIQESMLPDNNIQLMKALLRNYAEDEFKTFLEELSQDNNKTLNQMFEAFFDLLAPKTKK